MDRDGKLEESVNDKETTNGLIYFQSRKDSNRKIAQ